MNFADLDEGLRVFKYQGWKLILATGASRATASKGLGLGFGKCSLQQSYPEGTKLILAQNLKP